MRRSASTRRAALGERVRPKLERSMMRRWLRHVRGPLGCREAGLRQRVFAERRRGGRCGRAIGGGGGGGTMEVLMRLHVGRRSSDGGAAGHSWIDTE